MKRISFTCLAIATLLVLSVVTNAQTTGSQENNRQPKPKHDKEKHEPMVSNLTDAQKQQLKTIHKQFVDKRTALQQNGQLPREDYKKQMDAIRADEKAAMDKVLTPEQQAERAAKMNNRVSKHQAHATQKAEKLKTDLNLSDEQASNMRKIDASFAEKAKGIKTDKNLSEADRKTALKKLHADRQKETAAILTKDQMTKLKTMKHHKDKKGLDKPKVTTNSK